MYQPCVLITKKRYVGYSYETLEQKEPIFDAKGIETVRRDNCPAVEKVSFLCVIFCSYVCGRLSFCSLDLLFDKTGFRLSSLL